MLVACSVDIPIHINRFHLLCVASRILCGLGLNLGMALRPVPKSRFASIVLLAS